VICSSWRETGEYCIVIYYNYVEMAIGSNNNNNSNNTRGTEHKMFEKIP
jgi:hypothetical protein